MVGDARYWRQSGRSGILIVDAAGDDCVLLIVNTSSIIKTYPYLSNRQTREYLIGLSDDKRSAR